MGAPRRNLRYRCSTGPRKELKCSCGYASDRRRALPGTAPAGTPPPPLASNGHLTQDDPMTALSKPLDAADDPVLVQRVQRGDTGAFTVLMRRYNRRLYRTARAILKNDAAAEDALQEGYIAAYRHIGEFRGDAQIATWLTRIVVNQALQALRKTR